MEVLGLIIAGTALLVAVVALIFSISARQRSDARERLMWMQTIRNELRDMPAAAESELSYEDRRRWMRTCLALSAAFGRRAKLPALGELTSLSFAEAQVRKLSLRDAARREIDGALEAEADRIARRRYWG
jgi:hypothetical protein